MQIFLLGQQAEGRGQASSDSWREDQQWAQLLAFGWNLTKVKQVRQNCISFSQPDVAHPAVFSTLSAEMQLLGDILELRMSKSVYLESQHILEHDCSHEAADRKEVSL